MTSPHPLVVGFDLDMTLIDTRPGFAATLVQLGRETGVEMDVEAMSERLGPPLSHMLAPYYPADRITGLVDRFRAVYPDHAIAPTLAFAGAHDALAAVRRHGGRTVVVTGKFTPNAALHVEALTFDVDHLVGEVWGVGKAAVLERARCDGLRRRPRARRGGCAGGGGAERLRAHRRLHRGGAARGRHPRGAGRPSTTSRPGSTRTCSTSGSRPWSATSPSAGR